MLFLYDQALRPVRLRVAHLTFRLRLFTLLAFLVAARAWGAHASKD
jgi:hypothetical protein